MTPFFLRGFLLSLKAGSSEDQLVLIGDGTYSLCVKVKHVALLSWRPVPTIHECKMKSTWQAEAFRNAASCGVYPGIYRILSHGLSEKARGWSQPRYILVLFQETFKECRGNIFMSTWSFIKYSSVLKAQCVFGGFF